MTHTEDSNWNRLRLEQAQPRDRLREARTVQTKTPTLVDFGSHLGFTYRQSDGAQWHTQVRTLRPGVRVLTPPQAVLQDSLATLELYLGINTHARWLTPLDPQGVADPTYQLIHTPEEWWCVIDCQIYAASTQRWRQQRGYTETTFSTKNQPVATLSTVTASLDTIWGE